MDLNGAGDIVFKCELDGDAADDAAIVSNGAIFVREGGSVADIAPHTLTGFGTGSGPVCLDNAGNILWYGNWDDPDTNVDTGLFLNSQLIVQEGVTTVGGVLIDTISSGPDAFDISENGRWIIFEGVLADGRDGAFLIDLSDPTIPEPAGLGLIGLAMMALRTKRR